MVYCVVFSESIVRGGYAVVVLMVFKRVMKWLLSLFVTVVVTIVVMWLVFHYVLMNTYVPSASMYPTLGVGDQYISNRLAYTRSDPERYDIVVFRYPDAPSTHYVKRIIGLPGETIEIKDGHVYADGSLLDESFTTSSTGPDGTYHVPEGCYFMLGDNRESSNDSRRWINRYVKRDAIEAKVWFEYHPEFKSVK